MLRIRLLVLSLCLLFAGVAAHAEQKILRTIDCWSWWETNAQTQVKMVNDLLGKGWHVVRISVYGGDQWTFVLESPRQTPAPTSSEIKASALAKLTSEERAALGLKD